MKAHPPILNPPILNPFQRKGLMFLLPFGEVGRGREGLDVATPFPSERVGDRWGAVISSFSSKLPCYSKLRSIFLLPRNTSLRGTKQSPHY
ncbi:MAG: hypothetical protein ACYDCN_11360 [Bacteroidia bacterium]